MNIFWILPILSLFWIFLMYALYSINVSSIIFLGNFIFWLVIFFYAEQMYNWGTKIAYKHGHNKIAQLRERLKNKIIPPAKTSLLLISIISLIFAIYSLIK